MSKLEILRDRYGHKIASVESDGPKHTLRDEYGHKLGTYELAR